MSLAPSAGTAGAVAAHEPQLASGTRQLLGDYANLTSELTGLYANAATDAKKAEIADKAAK